MRFLSAIVVIGFGHHEVLSAQQPDCGRRPVVTDERLRLEVQGRAEVLARTVGSGDLKASYERTSSDIFSRYPDASRARINERLLYDICVELAKDRSMSPVERINLLLRVRRELLSTESDPAPDPVAARLPGEYRLTGTVPVTPALNILDGRLNVIHQAADSFLVQLQLQHDVGGWSDRAEYYLVRRGSQWVTGLVRPFPGAPLSQFIQYVAFDGPVLVMGGEGGGAPMRWRRQN